ncbi:hypothetical protein KsCSTR_36890 [Candidatus Kuenenia stuttgartiensis]|uniref:Uncharacterized protein n=1 Tax=Kuenenia stuttgartiensis TaxID=174633 RepID=Q1Q6C7_KUEST|nr:hypothetical protein KsCSTR_36890 [Candidatus Kuenenia stuttgartiensis]CAJ73130.1 unknown protein [Candidatus Kuenenia stuttgartiensis]
MRSCSNGQMLRPYFFCERRTKSWYVIFAVKISKTHVSKNSFKVEKRVYNIQQKQWIYP